MFKYRVATVKTRPDGTAARYVITVHALHAPTRRRRARIDDGAAVAKHCGGSVRVDRNAYDERDAWRAPRSWKATTRAARQWARHA